MKFWLAIGYILISNSLANAVDPNEILTDPSLEKRARILSKELRCVVCQNQSIDDSDARLARDMRILVRQRIMAGDTNHDVINYIVSRYGDFVLLRPPIKQSTFLLWFGPVIFAFIGVIGIYLFFRHQKSLTIENKATPNKDTEN